jgi:hypothetical protein
MFNWLFKLYLLIRGDRFARDKLEEIRDEIHKNTLDINSRVDRLEIHLVRIESELQSHINTTSANYEVLEQKINAATVASELMLQMLNDRFDALNLKIDLLRK